MKINEMNIVITGANGVTASVMMEYFSKHAGYIVGTVRQLSETWKRNKNSAIIEMDPLDHRSIDRAIRWINDEAGTIHVWLNIIGGFTMGNRVWEGNDVWGFMYNTNFMTTLNCCQQILPKMKSRKFGRIINMGSQAALQGMPLAGAYCASKAAVHTLTKIIALENGENITCNAILPGIIDTPANRKKMPRADHDNWITPIKIAEKIETVLVSDNNGKLIKI